MLNDHLLLKWNPYATFHPLAPATIQMHLTTLADNQTKGSDVYVWWGKISKSGRLGVSPDELKRLATELRKQRTHSLLFMYCPDGPEPSLHIGKLADISFADMRKDSHTPSYYQEMPLEIPFWFKLRDLCAVDTHTIEDLYFPDGEQYDPVSSHFYPLLVHQGSPHDFFVRHSMYLDLLAGSSEFSSVFISYGGPDAGIATSINNRLKHQGIETWFFPEDALPGQKLHRVMATGVATHDRVLLICSQHSLARPGVLNELERVLEREAREGGSERLLPISIDDYVYRDWAPSRPDLAQQIRSRVVTRIPPPEANRAKFEREMRKLIRALQKS